MYFFALIVDLQNKYLLSTVHLNVYATNLPKCFICLIINLQKDSTLIEKITKASLIEIIF